MVYTPPWVQQLAHAYLKETTIGFVLHGDLQSPVELHSAGGEVSFEPLEAYLQHQLFRSRQLVLRYDRRAGFQPRGPADSARWQALLQQLGISPEALSRSQQSPGRALLLLDGVLQAQVESGGSAAVVFPYAEELLPADAGETEEGRALLSLCLQWLSSRRLLEADLSLVWLSREKSLLAARLLAHPAVRALEIPLPDEARRLAWLQHVRQAQPQSSLGLTPEAFAARTAGMTLPQLDQLLEELPPEGLDEAQLSARRRALLHTEPAPTPLVSGTDVPAWVRNLEQAYAARTLSQFILYGNIFDKYRQATVGQVRYRSLPEYLMQVVFARHDLVLAYDRASGLSFRDDAVKRDLAEYLKALDQKLGTQLLGAFPKEPQAAFELLQGYFQQRLAEGKSLAFLLEYAETLAPQSPPGGGPVADRALLIQLLKWARDPLFVRSEMALVLITEKLHDLSAQLVSAPYTAALELPFPDQGQRLQYVQDVCHETPLMQDYLEMQPAVLAQLSAGLNIQQLNLLLAFVYRNRQPLTYELLTTRRKELIEREAGGLLAFVETRYTLADVAGHAAAKRQLQAAADAIRAGQLEVLPMGYLFSGPVGTGKTFLVRCFAGDIGIPMVVLKNFRSQWQGVTESNLEKVLGLLQAMSPVAVMIDEADAYLGNRNASGDSGVSSRVFSMIATFMANTDHRGRILWFLLTARPDLMPVDLKRQGRAEEHVALFYPETLEEKREMLAVMLRKTRLAHLQATDFDDAFLAELPIRSGADMEAALTRARFRAVQQGQLQPTVQMVAEAFADFIPPAYPEEVELMTLLAVAECTSRDLLPPRYRELPRAELLQRIDELKLRVR